MRRIFLALTILSGALVAAPVGWPATSSADTALPKVTLKVPVIVGSGHEKRTAEIRALGPQPKNAALVDDSGEHTVSVTFENAQPDAACPNHPKVRSTGLGKGRWCATFTGIRAGYTYKGDLAGAASVVSVEVAAREDWYRPAATVALGLLLALVLVWWTSTKLPPIVTTQLPKSGEAERLRITGLARWVATTRAAGHLSDADLLARLRWAKRHGKRALRNANVVEGRACTYTATELPPDGRSRGGSRRHEHPG